MLTKVKASKTQKTASPPLPSTTLVKLLQGAAGKICGNLPLKTAATKEEWPQKKLVLKNAKEIGTFDGD